MQPEPRQRIPMPVRMTDCRSPAQTAGRFSHGTPRGGQRSPVAEFGVIRFIQQTPAAGPVVWSVLKHNELSTPQTKHKSPASLEQSKQPSRALKACLEGRGVAGMHRPIRSHRSMETVRTPRQPSFPPCGSPHSTRRNSVMLAKERHLPVWFSSGPRPFK
ncbi:hypothetical protein Q8A67_025823 [Cirrhinus molitorella]|uniref:Uncharacterized protein n=1 Tax=Cirrhinus molitorella TaxID=172907 RepID=A0AA88NV66_9TELE|nr:hypothetical protein Q8A67_025823 [Cirrhinus molitorella]